MDKLIAKDQAIVGFIGTTLIAVLVHFHFSDFVTAYATVVFIIGGGFLLAMNGDVIDKRIGYAVCAASTFAFVTSFFASASELTDPGWYQIVKGATWVIFLTNLWGIGHLLDSKNQRAGRVLRIAAGMLFVIGVVVSYARQL